MSDWIEQEDWSTVNIGDQVRVTCYGAMFTAAVEDVLSRSLSPRLDREVYGLELNSNALTRTQTVFANEWSLSVPAKPAVELPTEPGIYVESGRKPNTVDLWTLHENGRWVSNAGSKYDSRVEEFAPFKKLEPVAVTAKKVLDDVSKFAWADGFMPQLRALGIKYGSIDE